MSLRFVDVRRRPSAPVSAALADLPPVLSRVWAARGIHAPPDLGLSALLPPTMLGVEAACQCLITAIRNDEHIMVVGDFDADGATATALAVQALTAMGAKQVTWQVPDRQRHGYGLSPILVESLLPQRPQWILTVDQGISAQEGVALAVQHGVKVVITDHHLPGDTLPNAQAIVNPNLKADPFPSKHLAGVGVVFYLMMALRSALREAGWFAPAREPRLDQWLDLVALGTVADLVPLDENNRRLVQQGLQRIRAGRCSHGVRALLESAGRNLKHVTASDLGFAAAPRLNAAGRLDDMGLGIRCLLSQDERTARQLADELNDLNLRRRSIQAQMQAQAEQHMARLDEALQASEHAAICVYDPSWHAGVVGLVASRLCEQWQRPVVALAPAEPNSAELKGSARSPAGVHMRDLLAAVAAHHPKLIDRFGGHARAAGLSLQADQRLAFEVALQTEAACLPRPNTSVDSDGPLSPAELSIEVARSLEQAGPWGQGFPEPVFDDEFRIVDRQVVGQHHLKLRLQAVTGGPVVEALAFGVGRHQPESWPETMHLLYRLDINRWQGREQVQLTILNRVATLL